MGMNKNQKRNIKMMAALIALFIIGIAIRWEYISKEITEAIDALFNR